MAQENIESLIREALSEHEKISREFGNYAPIYNSREMLSRIRENKDNRKYLLYNEVYLNVGLLAAKALDFDDKFFNYGTALHKLWNAVLVILSKARSFRTLTQDEKIAYQFYTTHGYDPIRTFSHMMGIDFNKSLNDNFILKHGGGVTQWRNPCILQGDYYAENNVNNNPDCLGINPMQENYQGGIGCRKQYKLTLQKDACVLKSTAAAVLDTWSVKGQPYKTTG